MRKHEFKCASCGNIFEKGWSDNDGQKDYKDYKERKGNFAITGTNIDGELICATCYETLILSKKERTKRLSYLLEMGEINIETMLKKQEELITGMIMHTCKEPKTKKVPKPPLGIMSKSLWEEKRLSDLNDAISRYENSDFEIPNEWINERNVLLNNMGNNNIFTADQLINFAKYVWYTKSLKDSKAGLITFFNEWKEMNCHYK